METQPEVIAVIVRWNRHRQDLYWVDPGFKGNPCRRVKASIVGSAGIHAMAFIPDGFKFDRTFRIDALGYITEITADPAGVF